MIDLKGKTFGELTAIYREGTNKWGLALWRCMCSCGNTRVFSSSNLRIGKALTCGCRQGESGRRRAVQLEKLHKSNVKPDAPLRYVLSQYKSSAKKKRREFSLSFEAFKQVIQCRCFWCGCSPDKTRTSDGGHTLRYNGIDRMDSSKGYTDDNCVPCCTRCNVAKNDMTKQEFEAWVEKVHRWLNL